MSGRRVGVVDDAPRTLDIVTHDLEQGGDAAALLEAAGSLIEGGGRRARRAPGS